MKKADPFYILPDGEDPDSFVNSNGYDRFQELVESSTPGFEYLFSSLGANLDLSLLDDKVALAGLARPLIDRVNQARERCFVGKTWVNLRFGLIQAGAASWFETDSSKT